MSAKMRKLLEDHESRVLEYKGKDPKFLKASKLR